MLALFCMREAGGWALLGDRTAADRAIGRDHQLYAKGPAESDPGGLEFFPRRHTPHLSPIMIEGP